MKQFNLLVTGVGGQGVVLASDVIGETALAAGYDVKKTDTLGMAQRGGSVVSHVRIGERVFSPLIKEGEVDILLAFEKLEAARWSAFLKPGAVTIVNNYARPPLSVNQGNEKYPDDEEIAAILKQQSNKVCFIGGTEFAIKLGNVRTLNTFMLGCVSHFLPLKVETWEEIISQHIPASVRDINIKAFSEGRKEIQNANL